MKRGRTAISLAAALLVCIAGCSSKDKDGGGDRSQSDEAPVLPEGFEGFYSVAEYPRTDGSETTHPLGVMLACKFTGTRWQWGMDSNKQAKQLYPVLSRTTSGEPVPENCHKGLMEKVAQSGTHQSYENLIEGRAELILVGREPSEDELSLAARKQVGLEIHPIAQDALVFIRQTTNPVEGLTTQQIRDIYSGKIASWQQLGWEDKRIFACQHEAGTACREAMMKLVMQSEPFKPAGGGVSVSMAAVYVVVRAEGDAMACASYYYDRHVFPPGQVKLFAVDGVMPDDRTVRSGEYPFVTRLYVVSRKGLDKQSPAARIRDWLRGWDGQAFVAECGYTPMR